MPQVIPSRAELVADIMRTQGRVDYLRAVIEKAADELDVDHHDDDTPMAIKYCGRCRVADDLRSVLGSDDE
jgi:hypothetical protein